MGTLRDQHYGIIGVNSDTELFANTHGAIRQPRQKRSRGTMDRVLRALELLLDEKPFEQITMIELAQRSGTGTSSIYARFKDKNSLVLGVHARLTETVPACLIRLTDPKRWRGKPLVGSISSSIVFSCGML